MPVTEEALSPGLAALAAGGEAARAFRLEVELSAPDITPWRAGNVLPGVWTFIAEEPGPHVAVVGVTHGNEIGGAIVLDRWLRARVRPLRGRLSLVFANLDAYARFDPDDPTASRFLDEDLNRLWDVETLEGGRRSSELRRARALRPFIDTVDVLLDLHSMLWPGEPLMLCGDTLRARRLGRALGAPALVVRDEGHEAGLRLIDYAPFANAGGQRTAILLEAGSHWATATPEVMAECAARLLRLSRSVAPDHPALAPATPAPPPRLVEVTHTITAMTNAFSFLRPFRSGQVVAERNSVIALDGEMEIRTPYADCLLVMPSLRCARGQTAVRLARSAAE